MAAISKPHVIIIGAGLSGLALAQMLREKGVSFDIFESAPSEERFQGWSIALHTVLGDLLSSLPDDMPPIKIISSLFPLDLAPQGVFYISNNPAVRMGVQVTDDSKMRVNRQRLRSWLATNINIQFGKTAVAFEGDRLLGPITVRFADGTSATGDMIVGSDGVNSAVRRDILHSISKPDPLCKLPLGIVGGELILHGNDVEEQLGLGHSGYIVTGFGETGTVLFVAVNSVSSDGMSANYYWFLSYTDPAAAERSYWTSAASREDMLRFAMAKTEALDPKFRQILQKTKSEDMLRPPLRFSECEIPRLPLSRLTLMGDAAHCMSPFRGEGGVHGLKDALNLSKAIVQISQESPDESRLWEILGGYQEEMLERGVAAIKKSRTNFQPAADSRRPVVWNQEMGPLPVEKISLDSIPRLA